jgi:DNA-binding transcriptional MerR regulator
VRAYQTRGLLQAPRRLGRSSVYDSEHVRRLLQVQRARARGASLALLQTLIREGRDLDGVWSPGPAADVDVVIDVTDATLDHTPDCRARREVPLAPLLTQLGADADSGLATAVRTLVDAGVFAGPDDEVRVPGSFACAMAALHGQEQVAAAAALRLAAAVSEAAGPVALLVAQSARGLDDDARHTAAARLGELAAAVVGQLAGREVLAVNAAAPLGGAVHMDANDRRPARSLTDR